MVKVEIAGIVLNLLHELPVIILKSKKGKILPIAVGIFEAQSILFVLEEADTSRPLTHDLMKNIMVSAGYEFERLEIYTVKNNTYYANMIVQCGGKEETIDCRPSDGIALALRFKAPIFSEETLLEDIKIVKNYGGKEFLKTGDLSGPISRKEAEDFRKNIESISAKDFWAKMKKE